MCYDISFTVAIRQLTDYFPELLLDEQISMNLESALHIAGHAFGNHPVIYRNRQDMKLHGRLMEWGCIPHYIQDEKSFIKQRVNMLNARSERILEDEKSYWYKIRNRRCLVPVTGIYEHRAIQGWKKKVPYFIKQSGQPLFFLPGLYAVAQLPDPETGEQISRFTFTIITRTANTLMSQIHNDGNNAGRMPLFLPQDLWHTWLDEGISPAQYKTMLDYAIPDEGLDCWPVYTIRSAALRPDGRAKNEPYDWEQLPALL